MLKTKTYPIVGARFRPPAQSILNLLPANTLLTLIHEPTNAVDPNAIAVHVATSDIPSRTAQRLYENHAIKLDELLSRDFWHLGYIPAEVAKRLRELNFSSAAGTLTLGPQGGPKVTFVVETPGDET